MYIFPQNLLDSFKVEDVALSLSNCSESLAPSSYHTSMPSSKVAISVNYPAHGNLPTT